MLRLGGGGRQADRKVAHRLRKAVGIIAQVDVLVALAGHVLDACTENLQFHFKMIFEPKPHIQLVAGMVL